MAHVHHDLLELTCRREE